MTKTVLFIFAVFFFSTSVGAQTYNLSTSTTSYTLNYYSTCQDVMERAVDFENKMTDCDQSSTYTKQRLACYKQTAQDVFKYKSYYEYTNQI